MKLNRVWIEYRSKERDTGIRSFDLPLDIGSAMEAVDRLDGIEVSLVTNEALEGKVIAQLAIGGGNDDRCVVGVDYGVEEEEEGPTESYLLMSSINESQIDRDVVTGGELVTYKDNETVNRETARRAAAYWMREGKRNPGLHWKLQ